MTRDHGSRGFTLLEIMVVMSIILILLSIAMPIYSASIRRAKEDAFEKSLHTLNQAIFQYTLDKQKAPKSLEDLVHAKYIKNVPEDIGGDASTWEVEEDTSIMAITQTDTGLVGVHSGSSRIGSNGKPYSEW